MAAACELPLSSGRLCGVDAQGRCDVCERAFCGSHRSMPVPSLVGSSHLVNYVDVCMACAHVPQREEQAREAAKQVVFEAEVQREAQLLAQAEATFWQTLHELCAAGYPGMQRRYRITYPTKHYFTSSAKVKRVDVGVGWHVGHLDFQWTAPLSGDHYVNKRTVSRPAMVVAPNWSVVHAMPDDVDLDQRNETVIRTSHQVWTAVNRLASYLPRR